MSDSATMGLSTTMKPRLLNKRRPKKVYEINIPGFGRVGFTRDKGEANMFGKYTVQSNLGAIVRNPDGRIREELDLGSGLVTNVGVLALAYDSQLLKAGKAKESFNLFSTLQYHQWGSKETAAATTDIKLTKAETNKNTKSANKAVKDTSHTVTTSGEGKPKFVSTAKIEAESTLEIKEWGIFTFEELEAATGEPLTAVTATSAKVTGTPLTASSEEARGERLKILNASESEDIWGLITENTTSEVKVPAWYKTSTGAVKEPTATSKYKLRPVMFDHRTFAVINVESGNTIEFPWELEIKSGG